MARSCTRTGPISAYIQIRRSDVAVGPSGGPPGCPAVPIKSYAAFGIGLRVTNHLGSTSASLLADGSLVNPTDYTPFGQLLSGGTSDPYQFTGKDPVRRVQRPTST
jgi:hypothetical protein